MNCRQAQSLLHAYLDGELDLVASLELEQHVAHCPACRSRQAAGIALKEAIARSAARRKAPARLVRTVCRQSENLGHGDSGGGRRWLLPVAVPALGAVLALAVWLGVLRPGEAPVSAPPAEKVVYHINDSRNAATALRNLSNHLEQSPNARIVVVAHNDGVDFLLQGARDSEGKPFVAMVSELKARGVDFRVCGNTLTRRHIDPTRLIPQATLVPSGVAEIARLQIQEGFRYLKP